MTTKEQELKALAQIRKIVEGLGEGSYVATAFEGCFEIAEDNIGNDFACSMKQRAEKAQKEADYYKHIAERVTDENEKLEEQLKGMNEKVLSKDDLHTVRNIVINQHDELIDNLHESESKIVEFCENTDSEDFQKAVRDHKKYIGTDKNYRELEARLYKINEAY